MKKTEVLEKVKKVLDEMSDHFDSKQVKETNDELCAKGIAKGCYQNTWLLCHLLELLTLAESYVKGEL